MPLAVIREHLRIFEHHKSNLLSSYSDFLMDGSFVNFFLRTYFPPFIAYPFLISHIEFYYDIRS